MRAADGVLPSPGAGRASVSSLARVLVVDDDPFNLMLVSAQLETLGLMPVLAADGKQAVALAGQRPFDLILMDLSMPVLDGLQATAAIRRVEAEERRPTVPVVAYSSNSIALAVLLKNGFQGALSKPCALDQLNDCLRQWCPTYGAASDEYVADPHNSCWYSGVQKADGAGLGHR